MPNRDERMRAGLGPMLAQVARHWRRAVDTRLQPFGLTEATWLPLLRLARAPRPMRQKDLAASLGLDGSSVVRLLDSLEQAGLVERRQEDADRRARAIVLTDQGRAVAGRVEAVSRAVREELFAGLDDADLAAAYRVVDHIHRKLVPAPDEPEGA